MANYVTMGTRVTTIDKPPLMKPTRTFTRIVKPMIGISDDDGHVKLHYNKPVYQRNTATSIIILTEEEMMVELLRDPSIKIEK